MFVSVIIAAGGRGQRFGGVTLKQLVPVGGRPMLERSVAAFLAHPSIHEVIVALPQQLVDDPPPYLRDASKPLRLVAGGARRQDSVANAFRAASNASDIIVIHDAARPFASADLIARTIAAAAENGAALAALEARDTVKLVLRPFDRLRAQHERTQAHHERAQARDERTTTPLTLSLLPFGDARGDPEALEGSKGEHVVKETLPRETVYLAQTPQAFRHEVLRGALAVGEREHLDATDEAALAERAGYQVRLVEGEASNIKITTPDDLILAEAIAQARTDARAEASDDVAREGKATRTGRAGTGYDLHRLVPGRPLVVGGVTIPSDRGALGHSDADVVCHAITDAILGAACLGDIGRHFPDSDPQWKDASSLDLLARASTLVREQGFEVGNVDVTVVLEAPKIRDHIDVMRAAVATAIGIDPSRVSIKAKTNEGVDAIGRGEAIAAHAVVLVRKL